MATSAKQLRECLEQAGLNNVYHIDKNAGGYRLEAIGRNISPRLPAGRFALWLDGFLKCHSETEKGVIEVLRNAKKARPDRDTNPDRPVRHVDSIANFEFWHNSFKYREKAWRRQKLQEFISGDVAPFEKEAADMIRALEFIDNPKYRVLSPDGFDLERDKEYNSFDECRKAIEDFTKRFERQGYYSLGNRERIPLDELFHSCKVQVN